MDTTRRKFLTTAGAAALATSLPGQSRSQSSAQDSNEIVAGGLQSWITDDDRRMTRAPSITWMQATDNIARDTIVVNPAMRFQTILGFGAAFTDGSCSLFSQLAPAAREQLFHHLFHPSQMGLNVCRTCIGSSDHSASLYSFDDGESDPELKRFSIDHDRAYILPILRQARSVNPDLFLFSSPWSPPGWMKDNGSMLGGCMRHAHMPEYANYFVKFLLGYQQEDVPIQAVTVQNEVDADQQGLMPACFWPQECEADFVSDHLGPAFEKHGVKTRIWIIDHNYNLWGRAIAELEIPGVRKYVNSVAWHGYSGQPEWMMRVQNAFPEVEMHWTEGSPDHDDPEYLRCWAAWAQKFSDILNNGCRSITGWCFATDERGGPNIGPYPMGGLVTIDSKTKDIYHSGEFWAMEHYSRFIKRAAVRIDSQSSGKGLSHTAFENPDRSFILVITNPGAERICELECGDKRARLSLTANSVTTLAWSCTV
jgi:glucosylceramidase